MTVSEWDDHAEGWDDDPAARAYAAAAFGSLEALLSEGGTDLAESRVCDFGCGTGLLTERLAARCARIDAIDSSPGMLAVLDAKIAARGWPHVATSARLAAGAPRYDLVVCSSVCGFLDDYPTTAAELVAGLVPGGRFVQWDWEADPASGDAHGVTSEEISSVLTAVGLEAVRVDVGFRIEIDGATMAPLMGSGRAPVRA